MARIIFNPATTDLDDFLQENAPSKVFSKNGDEWISVKRHSSELQTEEETDIGEYPTEDLETAWDAMYANEGGSPTHEAICSFAKQHRCVVGKWLLYAATGTQVDDLWKVVAKAVTEGQLGSSAKVSTRNEKDESHVICVYSDDFTDVEAVQGLERGIRRLGYCKNMSFKPDLFTYLGIYTTSRYKMKPTLYTSELDSSKKDLVFKFVQPREDKSQTRLTTFFENASGSTPRKSSHLSKKLKTKGESTNKRLKRKTWTEDKSQAKLETFFENASGSSPRKRSPLSKSQKTEGESKDKQSKRSDDVGGSSGTSLGPGPDAPPLPDLRPL